MGAAGIGELKLLKALAALKENDHGWAQRVIEAIKLRAGLLPGANARGVRLPAPHLSGVPGRCLPGLGGRLCAPGREPRGRGRALRERVPARLADLIRGGRLTARERAAAGVTLAVAVTASPCQSGSGPRGARTDASIPGVMMRQSHTARTMARRASAARAPWAASRMEQRSGQARDIARDLDPIVVEVLEGESVTQACGGERLSDDLSAAPNGLEPAFHG